MFKLEDNLKFVNVDIDYLKALHDACSEVYYLPYEYENKPCVGILISKDNYKYVLPLTSAKEKHKTWKNSNTDRMLIYEMVNHHKLSTKDIYTKVDDTDVVKHILSAIDVKKMIPILDTVINEVDINYSKSDSEDEKKYKDLLNKEYGFCVKIANELISKASKVYDKQMETGKVQKFACDFKELEKVADNYSKK